MTNSYNWGDQQPQQEPQQQYPNQLYSQQSQQPAYPYAYPPQQQKSNAGLIATIIGAVIVLLAFGLVFLGFQQGWFKTASSEDEVVIVTETAAPVQQQAPAPAQAPAPEANRAYSNYRADTSVTSSSFAANVYSVFTDAYASSGNPNQTISVYSPVTGQTYTMRCSGSSYVTCRGGNNAVVSIW